MSHQKNSTSAFSVNFRLTLVGLVACAIAFVYYVHLEKQIEHANAMREQSLFLAAELRQSSDDLTRMVRTYVATGNPIYKEHYQEILDVRDGKKPRPAQPFNIYWDLVLTDDKRPRPASGQAIPLLQLMKKVGFTEAEFSKLAEAKANSDALTSTEFAAMKLMESPRSPTEDNRIKATQMLYDTRYHQAKAAIMRPISEFYQMLDKRTFDAVQSNINAAFTVRFAFIFFCVLLVFLLWRSYISLQAILGASVDDLYAHIARIGGGDFTHAIPVAEGGGNSVLNWLSETQINLAKIDAERKLAADELVNSGKEFRLLAEAMPQIVWVARADGWTTYCNQQWVDYTGLTLEESYGHGWNKSFHPDDRQRALEAWQNAVNNNGPYSLECRLRRADGNYRWWLIRGVPIFDESGEIAKWFGTCTDIDEIKRAEEALREKEERLALATIHNGIGIWDWNLQTQEMIWDDSMYALYHIRREDFSGTEEAWRAALHPDDLERGDREVEAAISGEKPFDTDFRVIWPNGEIRHIKGVAKVFRDDRGTPLRMLGTNIDITERNRLERELQQLNQTLSQQVKDEVAKNMEQERILIHQSRLAAMGEMVHNIAHQWRQPISALNVLLSNIKDAYEYNELTKEYLDMEVQTGNQLIQKMSSTIDDFRSFFKPNRVKQSFIVCDSVEEAINMVSASFKNNFIEIEKKECDRACEAMGFPNEFAQVVLNILGNARDAIATRKALGKVHIQSEMGPDTLTVSIRDNGGGIPEEILPKVFDPYFTTKDKGSGIGLYMSKMIMDHMDGKISIRNAGEGVEVLLTLPLVSNPAV